MALKLVKAAFKPGVVKDDSSLTAGNGYVDADKVRFRLGQPEVIGGWELASPPGQTFTGICRGAHAWAAATGDKVLAFGTESKLYDLFGGDLNDITPQKYHGTLTDPFTMVNGSSTVTVDHPDHGLKTSDTVSYALADAAGGLTIDGDYTITRIVDLDTYEIDAGSNASSDATGGGNVEVTATLDTGLTDGTAGSGFGTGTYGSGYWGLPTGGDVDPRVWSVDNWGNNGLFVPRNGALYEWQPSGSYENVVTSGDFSASTGWVAGTGWTISAGVATATAGSASSLTQDLTGIISGGLVYEITMTITRSAGSLQFAVTSADSGDTNFGEAISKDGTYTRRFRAPSNPTTIKFTKDASFIGTIDNVTISLASTAYRLQSAPQYSTCMFVDPNRIVVLGGTVQYNGTFNRMCVRWSDQENNETWTPSDTNLAGEYVLARGSKIVGAIATRGENLIFTDEAVYSMRFTGDTGSVFSFSLIGTGCGLAGKNAVAEHNGFVFWWSISGQLYVYRGGEPQILECPLRKDVVDNLSFSQNEKIYCGINSKHNEAWFFYPDARDGNECNRYIAYSWTEDHWTCGTFDRTAWIRGGVLPYPVAFSTTGKVYYHERNTTADGSTISWYVKTGFMQLDAGSQLMAVTKYFPDFESQGGKINLYLYFRNYPNQTERAAGPYELSTTEDDVNFRQVGREMAIKWAAGTNSTFMRLGVQTFEVRTTGMGR